ncbi:hypothetical protein [Streptomyces sp. NPDC088752]|uniref:hypothetical protein n=1 Tax=Streptomyces sp. NPDC088752 TaxID=3154963 RepID=UPI0034497A46
MSLEPHLRPVHPHTVYRLADGMRRPEPTPPRESSRWRSGLCWFWCDWSVEKQVTDVGVLQAPDSDRARLTACAPCLAVLAARGREHAAYSTFRDITRPRM